MAEEGKEYGIYNPENEEVALITDIDTVLAMLTDGQKRAIASTNIEYLSSTRVIQRVVDSRLIQQSGTETAESKERNRRLTTAVRNMVEILGFGDQLPKEE